MTILTEDTHGRPNGYLMTLWNALEQPELRPEQVYMTIIAKRCRKGPHLHMKREGRFVLLNPEASVVVKDSANGSYALEWGKVYIIPAGVACALYNVGKCNALVLNMPSPAWSAAEPDDWPVETWEDPEGWAE